MEDIIIKQERQTTLEVGKQYFFKGIANYHTGRVVKIVGSEVVLEDCAWIANTKRFYDSMATGEFEEVEPYPDGWLVTINLDTVESFTEWKHALPRKQI